MKASLWLIVFIVMFAVTSCNSSDSTDPQTETGVLKIYNTTNDFISVDIPLLSIVNRTIPAHTSQEFIVTINSKSTTVTVSSEGTYRKQGNSTATVTADQTTDLYINADCGVLNLINSSNASITATISNQDHTINANSSSQITVFIGSQNSANVGISYRGQYVTEFSETISILRDAVSNKTITPTAGILNITNNTNDDVTVYWSTFEYTISSHQTGTFSFNMPTSTSISTTFDVDGLYVLEYSHTSTVTRNQSASYTVGANAGCLKIVNNSSIIINDIYVSLSTDWGWGSDDLPGTLLPNYYIRYQLEADSYDLKIVNANGVQTILYDIIVSNNQTYTYTYAGKGGGDKDDKSISSDSSSIVIWDNNIE
jgi:hypothetical protein